MLIISHNRKKCIGCHYCVDLSFEHWRMSKKDGKSVLLNAVEKKGIYTLKLPDDDQAYEDNKKAAEACPVKIIQVKR